MLSNFFKIAFRNLFKHKGYSLINVLGLAIGMGVCLFLVLLDQYAYNFDAYHQNGDRIYRLADKVKTQSGSIVDAAITPAPWGEAIKQDFSQVEEQVRFMGRSHAVAKEEKVFRYYVTYVDRSILDVFTYPLKQGDAGTALSRPGSIVLTEQAAEVYFGNENPLGQTLLVDEKPHEVTGVLRKLPDQSSFTFNMLIPFSSLTEETYSSLNNWTSHNLYTYLLLKEGASPDELEAGLSSFITKQFGEEGLERYQPHLQPLESIYLNSNLFAEQGSTLDVAYIYIFTAIAFLILLIACINFINLATARGMERAREVGVRKVLGAGKMQLVIQFLSEALILSVISVFIAMQLVELALPWFNDLADWNVQAAYLENPLYLISAVGMILIVSLLAGGYPAFYLSAFQPAPVLKGDLSTGKRRSLLRTTLVVSQFAVAIFLIISSAVVQGQLDFLKNKDLGFETRNIMVTGIPDNAGPAERETIREELSRRASISAISLTSSIPGDNSGSIRKFRPEGEFAEDGLLVNYYSVDEQFLNLFDVELKSGRNFNPNLASDSSDAFIINEAAARKFGWSDPLEKTIVVGDEEEARTARVVGLAEDFHFETLHNSIRPLILQYRPENFGSIAMKLNTADLSGTAGEIVDFMKSFNAGLPVNYYFLEEDIADEYTTENVIGEMLRYFTYLTILIACMGLFGLASYTIIQRRQEIGIRKVLGATIAGIVATLSREFIKLVVIGFLVAAPLAYFLVNQWLNSFAYSTEMGLLVFLGSGLLAVAIAVVTVSYHAIQAATMNPVKSLRSE